MRQQGKQNSTTRKPQGNRKGDRKERKRKPTRYQKDNKNDNKRKPKGNLKETTRKAQVYHKENMIPEANHKAVQKDTERNRKMIPK